MIVLWGFTISLLFASVGPALAKESACGSDALKESMRRLALATGEALPPATDDCPAQLAALVKIADKAQERLSQSSHTALGAWRLALVSVVLSALALLSAPVITLLLFRRYGLISWSLNVGDSTSNTF